ncbi:aquaporin-7 isoform X2 [Diceros bicornis minor]|uniref:aquaporin-7 isoform X2 n=1 Tax=Diceros bicornis minor TaxID=77932 RepID=UPI0026EB962E|nr:aquaporin-7 isoform X2 [Diceros bicornis minor]
MVLGDQFGSFLGVNLGFGFGVTMGVHVGGNISGAHMNAALTFTNCALGRMSWKKFPVYVLGQFLGSFLAAATIYCLFYTAIIDYSGGYLTVTGPTATASIFATYLPDHMTLWRGFLDEVSGPGRVPVLKPGPPQEGASRQLLTRESTRTLEGDCTTTCLCQWVWAGGTAEALWLGLGPGVAVTASALQVLVTGLLQLCLFAITDKGNNPALQGTQAVVIGILVVIIGVSLGMNTGYAINPSRDLPPRFFSFLAGWGTQVFRRGDRDSPNSRRSHPQDVGSDWRKGR